MTASLPMTETPPPEYLFWSAARLARTIRCGELTSRTVTGACLEQIARVNPIINAAVLVVADSAMEEAGKCDREAAGGRFRGPLHGVPISIKDSIDTAGIVTTGGTAGRRGFVPERDAPVVRRLREAGAVLLAKTNTPELTMGGETVNTIYGRTCNPYDPSRSPGGSSGGSVALVAAGGSCLELGSDTGGSIREPAHFCGVAGIKPTSGRVPRTGHIVPWGLGAFDSLTQIGPIARYVGDLWPALSCIAGPDDVDPGVVPAGLRDPGDVDVGSLRIAWHLGNGIVTPDADLCRGVHNAAAGLSDRGAVLLEDCPAVLPELSRLLVELRRSLLGEILHGLLEGYGTRTPGPGLKALLSGGTLSGGSSVDNRLLQRIDRARSRALRFMRDHDAILCAPSVSPARPHGANAAMDYEHWSPVTLYNLLGWPCGVVRSGTSAAGDLPVGVQVVAPPWREDIVLAVLEEIERSGGGYRPPDIASAPVPESS